MIKINDIVLFTASFPFGNGETFLESEIIYLAKNYKQIYVLPQKSDSKIVRALPDNCKIITKHIEEIKQINFTSLKAILEILPIILYEIRKCGFDRNELIYKISHLKSLYRRAENINFWIESSNLNNVIYYSYWLGDSSTILYFIGKKRKGFRFVSRAHGFDLFEERQSKNHIPYRKFQFKYAEKIFSVSKMGMNYLRNAYPKLKLKFDYAYLGSDDHGVNTKSSDEEIFQLVSCSNMIALKRIHLIIEILSKLDLRINWVHFGDGPLREELEEKLKTLPNNISAEFKGFVPNSKLISYYKENFVDLFINVSETEGLPVSIMEAISFGIPVIATDVGGMSEIVVNHSGLLLDKNIQPDKVAVNIKMYLKGNTRDIAFRGKVREFWKENFYAEKNYLEFFNQLEKFGYSDVS